jgi:hypothetical protein
MGQASQLEQLEAQLEAQNQRSMTQLEAQNQQFMAQLEAQNQRSMARQERLEEQIRHLLVDHRAPAASVPSEGVPPE